VARAIGRPDGARDVGAALAANPTPIIVPCHRVVAANGALTGFSAPGGLATKRKMLELGALRATVNSVSSADHPSVDTR
jgi:methylated-DNA-[protein]-cysteine S-methyltransferase